MVIFIMHALPYIREVHKLFTPVCVNRNEYVYIKSLLYFIIEIFLFYNNIII